ncbi:hypothetical protein LCGC14_2192870 [marine sediment metagenome]|uniref:Uncharacterized protein n=1 Tax=marine sediment metagenome TaxID=412755 RepID=A0A0F9E643_9ZZZZ
MEGSGTWSIDAQGLASLQQVSASSTEIESFFSDVYSNEDPSRNFELWDGYKDYLDLKTGDTAGIELYKVLESGGTFAGYWNAIPLGVTASMKVIGIMIDSMMYTAAEQILKDEVKDEAQKHLPDLASGINFQVKKFIDDSAGYTLWKEIYGGLWGEWKPQVSCPANQFISGAQVRFENSLGDKGDDTAMNGLKIACSSFDSGSRTWYTVYDGLWGEWKPQVTVDSITHYACGAQVRFENSLGDKGDDTAMNGLAIKFCSFSDQSTMWKEIYGGLWGEWKPQVTVDPIKHYACGAQVRFQDSLGDNKDDTAMNGLNIKFCPYLDDLSVESAVTTTATTITLTMSEDVTNDSALASDFTINGVASSPTVTGIAPATGDTAGIIVLTLSSDILNTDTTVTVDYAQNGRVIDDGTAANELHGFSAQAVTNNLAEAVVPSSGDWIVTQSYTITADAVINGGNLLVQNNSVLTIDNGSSLDVDLTNYSINVESGSGILVKSGSKIN